MSKVQKRQSSQRSQQSKAATSKAARPWLTTAMTALANRSPPLTTPKGIQKQQAKEIPESVQGWLSQMATEVANLSPLPSISESPTPEALSPKQQAEASEKAKGKQKVINPSPPTPTPIRLSKRRASSLPLPSRHHTKDRIFKHHSTRNRSLTTAPPFESPSSNLSYSSSLSSHTPSSANIRKRVSLVEPKISTYKCSNSMNCSCSFCYFMIPLCLSTEVIKLLNYRLSPAGLKPRKPAHKCLDSLCSLSLFAIPLCLGKEVSKLLGRQLK